MLRGSVKTVFLVAFGLGLGFAQGMGEALLEPQEADSSARGMERDQNDLSKSNHDKGKVTSSADKDLHRRSLYPAEPQLRISSSRHRAKITSIDTDSLDRFVVTGSEDKTVQVRSLVDGKLLRTLRPPVGPGDVGKVFAVAISPDGRNVAVGGWQSGLQNGERIYIFDRDSGRLFQILEGLPSATLSLTFSRDGSRFAAGFDGSNGIRLWNTAAGTSAWTVEADENYGGSVYGLSFDPEGRLATASFDGQLRLYETNGPLRLTHKVLAHNGQRPFELAFSPSGERLAVGHSGNSRVSLHRGTDLGFIGVPPDKFDIDLNENRRKWRGGLSRVAWSRDGEILFAGIGHNLPRPVKQPIYAFQGGGTEEPTQLRVNSNTVKGYAPSGKVMDIAPFGQSGVVFGTESTVVGAIEGSKWHNNSYLLLNKWRTDRKGYAWWENYPDLRLSHSGRSLALQYFRNFSDPGWENWVRYDLDDRQLSPLPNDRVSAELVRPRTRAPGLSIGYRNDRTPSVNGVSLGLDPGDTSRVVAVAPGDQSFVLGTDRSLRRFDREGNQLWRLAVPGATTHVNISGSGGLVVAAFSDGTLRWYRMSDGTELLALYVLSEKGNPWVAWTPKGYYDVSPGRGDLIGWHINHGANQAAQFYSADLYEEIFYRPNIVSSVLELLDGDAAILVNDALQSPGEELIARQKPDVELLAPTENAEVGDDVTIKYRLTSWSRKPIVELRIMANGRKIESIRDSTLLTTNTTHSVTVKVPLGSRQLSILASTTDGFGPIVSRRIDPSQGDHTEPDDGQGTLYALVIGVSKYRDKSIRNLKYADDDARDVSAALEQQTNGLYKDVKIVTLIDSEATGDKIKEALVWLKDAADKDDSSLLYIAGHGLNRDVSKAVPEGDFYFLPHDADRQG